MAGRPLTIYLLKQWITDAKSAVRDNASVTSREFQIADLAGQLFVRLPEPHSTEWIDCVESIAGGLLDGAQVSSMGCLVIVNVDGRFFALAFGTGWTLLDSQAYEQNFGLRVVVNAIDPGQLRVVDARSLGTVAMNQRRQTNRKTVMSNFDMNLDREMLTGVTGSAQSIDLLGQTITGKDSLKIRRVIE